MALLCRCWCICQPAQGEQNSRCNSSEQKNKAVRPGWRSAACMPASVHHAMILLSTAFCLEDDKDVKHHSAVVAFSPRVTCAYFRPTALQIHLLGGSSSRRVSWYPATSAARSASTSMEPTAVASSWAPRNPHGYQVRLGWRRWTAGVACVPPARLF